MTRKRMPLAAIVAISVAILAACSGDAQTAAAPAPVAVAPAHRTGHLTVTVVGRGPDVILIPGLASPRELWDGVVPALSRMTVSGYCARNVFSSGSLDTPPSASIDGPLRKSRTARRKVAASP